MQLPKITSLLTYLFVQLALAALSDVQSPLAPNPLGEAAGLSAVEPPKKKPLPHITPVYKGLKNVSNTCYFNTIIQAISALTEVSDIILEADAAQLLASYGKTPTDVQGRTWATLVQLQAILYTLRRTDEAEIPPYKYMREFVENVTTLIATDVETGDFFSALLLEIGKQHDAHEFLGKLVEDVLLGRFFTQMPNLENRLNELITLPTVETFYDGDDIDHTNTALERVVTISIADPRIEFITPDGFQLWNARGPVPEGYKNTKAGEVILPKSGKFEKSVSLGCAPPILIVYVQRFFPQFDEEGVYEGLFKLERQVAFETTIDISKYMTVFKDEEDQKDLMAKYMTIFKDEEGQKDLKEKYGNRCMPKPKNGGPVNYRLYNMSIHSGTTPNSGHYMSARADTTSAKNGDGAKWKHFSDSSVSAMSEKNLISTHGKGSTTAYLLYYVREDEFENVVEVERPIPKNTMTTILDQCLLSKALEGPDLPSSSKPHKREKANVKAGKPATAGKGSEPAPTAPSQPKLPDKAASPKPKNLPGGVDPAVKPAPSKPVVKAESHPAVDPAPKPDSPVSVITLPPITPPATLPPASTTPASPAVVVAPPSAPKAPSSSSSYTPSRPSSSSYSSSQPSSSHSSSQSSSSYSSSNEPVSSPAPVTESPPAPPSLQLSTQEPAKVASSDSTSSLQSGASSSDLFHIKWNAAKIILVVFTVAIGTASIVGLVVYLVRANRRRKMLPATAVYTN